MSTITKLTLFIGILVLVCGCNRKEVNTDDGMDPKDSIETKIKIKINNDTLIRPLNCELIFDASVSMRGYVDATVNGSFAEVVGKLNNLAKDSTYTYVFDNSKHLVNDFMSKIHHKNIKWADESDLFAMIKDIMTQASHNPNNCYILVTDGIISGSNKEIQKDSTFNISKPSILQSRIEKIVSQISSDSEVSLMVACFMSPFKGKYYNYDNSYRVLNNDLRPFYVLVAGGTPQVNYTLSMLDQLEGKTVQYGRSYAMTFSSNGKLVGNNKYCLNSNIKEKGLIITANLKDLPVYARDYNFIRQNLEILREGKGVRKLKLDEDYTFVIEGDKMIVTFTDKIKNLLPSTFRFKLHRSHPMWVNEANTDNDKKNYSPEKTLNLVYFLNPFIQLCDNEYLNDIEKSKVEITKK